MLGTTPLPEVPKEGWGCRPTTAWLTASYWSSTQGCRCHAFVFKARETPSTSGFGSQTAALVPTYSSAQNEGNNIIDHSLQPRSQLPLISHDIAFDQIPSVHAKLWLNVSETNRTKIKNGEFIELANILENKNAQRDEKPLIVIDGIIATKEKQKKQHYHHWKMDWCFRLLYEYISVSSPC